MRENKKSFTRVETVVLPLALFVGAFTLPACSNFSVGTSSSSGSVSIGGTLGSIGTSGILSKTGDVNAEALSVSDIQVMAMAMSEPPEIQKVTLGTDGKFTLNFSNTAAGSDISMYFKYKDGSSNAGKQAGIVKFCDSTRKDMTGNKVCTTSVKIAGTVSMGAVNIDSTGNVSVDVSTLGGALANSAVTLTSAFDFTGTWKVAKYDKTLPEGYSPACAQGSNDCNGPSQDSTFYIKRISGVNFNPDATCSAKVAANTFNAATDSCGGTSGSNARFAVQAWASQTAYNTCGQKVGVTYDAAKAYMGADFSNSGVSSGAFTYTSGWTNGWQDLVNAKAQYDQMQCEMVTITMASGSTKPGFKCKDSVSNYYRIELGGGCKLTATGQVADVNNWSALTGGTPTSSSTGLPTGYITNTVAYTNVTYNTAQPAGNVTCDFTYGTFNASDAAVTGTVNESNFNFNNINKVSAGASCGDPTVGTNAQKIGVLRCLADYYQSKRYNNVTHQADDTICLQDMMMDWTATQASNFIIPHQGAPRAHSEYVFSPFTYTSNDVAIMEDEQVHYNGVQVGNSFIPCKVGEHFKFMFKKRTSTQVVAEFISETRQLDFSQPACGKLNSLSRAMFLLNKQ